MKVSIPLYIEEKREASGRTLYHAHPLFTPHPVRVAATMDRVVNRVAQDIRETMGRLGRDERHDALARFAFSPAIDDRVLEVPLDMRKVTTRIRLLIAAFPWMGRRVAFSPTLPSVWFAVEEGEALSPRASEVYTAHFRAKGTAPPRGISGSAWVTSVTFEIQPRRVKRVESDPRKVALASDQEMAGDVELIRTGTCLSWADMDSLSRALEREHEIEELDQILAGKTRRAVLLLGPRLVGKTALVHELVRRRVRRRPTLRSRRNVWQLAPQRLISGMSFLGQWEQRVLAIAAEAARQDHVLYFDDVLGLYTAGMSASSDLSIAQVLRPFIEKRAFRFLAEMTPEQFRVLKELDRGFADLFHVVPVRETSHQETLEIGIGLQRELEVRLSCRFDLEALPTVLDLVARQSRDAAFPGKMASFMTHLAVKHSGTSPSGAEIGRKEVLDEFEAKTGLVATFLDDRLSVTRASVVDALAAEVVGQPLAVEAMADAVMIARARLADPSRPLASLLMLGPTGVGKTQCARALAKYLFGDPARMLRLDMNEYLAAGSASRLLGTLHHPEGALTAAVRRQPFCVLLLDEIEKAHPEVLDLLLQVLGDGRLTDGRGRTTDFGNCLVVMTSNLGAREASEALGFGAQTREAGAVYRRAAERFFRPELFNRIDRLLPFGRLDRPEMEKIAHMLIDSVLRRGGLVDRRCLLSVEPGALERIVDAGFEPELGARALRRVVEARITQAVADRLARESTRLPTLVTLGAGEGKGEIAVKTHVFRVVDGEGFRPDLQGGDGRRILARIDERLQAIDARLARLAPTGEVEAGRIGEEALRYFGLREQLVRLERWREALVDRRPPGGARTHPPRSSTKDPVRLVDGRVDWNELLLAESPRQHVATLVEGARRFGEHPDDKVHELSGETGILEELVATVQSRDETEVTMDLRPPGRVLVLRALTGSVVGAAEVLDRLRAVYAEAFGGTTEASACPEERLLTLQGPLAGLAAHECGTQLFFLDGGGFIPVAVTLRDDRVADASLPPIVRFHVAGTALDVRSRVLVPRFPDASDIRLMRVLARGADAR